MIDSVDEAKALARRAALAARGACDPSSGDRLGAHLLRAMPPPFGAVVAGFWPLPGEIDIRTLLLTLAARGHQIVLPVTPRRGLPLGFRRWQPGETLQQGRFGTLQPAGGPELTPDYLLVPLLGFDRQGNRLGYGGGYYDRTLAGLPGAIAIGCAFAAQELDAVPVGPHDRKLAAIATETGVLIIRD